MNILALETATDNCSVALSVSGDIRVKTEFAPRKQAQLLLPMVDAILAEAGIAQTQLDTLVFGQGPGSFTGLRVAAAASQGIAMALDLPVVGVSTLAAIAHQQFRRQGEQLCLACLDARMSEVYWGLYHSTLEGHSQVLSGDALCTPDSVSIPADLASQGRVFSSGDTGSIKLSIAGSGAHLLNALNVPADWQTSAHDGVLPDAQDVLLLGVPRIEAGDMLPADQALPVYLRNKVAETESERRVRRAETENEAESRRGERS